MRTFDDRVEKVIGMLLAGELNLGIEVDRSPVPALRDDAIKDCSGPMLIIDPRQENAELGCDTGPRLLLQRPFVQYAFEQSLAFDQACTGDSRGQTMRELTLECCLPVRSGASSARSAPARRYSTGPSSTSISPVSTTAASVPSNGR